MLIYERTKENNKMFPDWTLIEIDGEGQRWIIGYINAERNAKTLVDLFNKDRRLTQDCNVTRGDIQCPAMFTFKDEYSLNCRYIINHYGKHKTCYENGYEWE